MYEPEHFRITDRSVLIEVIKARPLGLLITAGLDGASADCIPFIPVEQDGVLHLRAHVAKANPVWQALQKDPRVLVVFQAEDHYVSPSWYETKRQTGRVVPTWNYVMVQVQGSATVHEEAGWLHAQVDAMTTTQEQSRAKPWAVADAPLAFTASQLRAIVGLEIEISDIRGKFKLSQNRNAADQTGVVEGLRATATGRSMAERMNALKTGKPNG